MPFRQSSHASARAQAAPRVFCFSIQAAAEPGILPRVMELFAKRNLVPSRWVSDLCAPAHGGLARELSIDVQVEGLSPELCDFIARCLRQIYGVSTVLTSEKSPGARASLWA